MDYGLWTMDYGPWTMNHGLFLKDFLSVLLNLDKHLYLALLKQTFLT